MTREEAKELLPIIKAYAEGKKIQVKCKTDSNALTEHWVDVTNPDLDNFNCYRIKPTPTYRPFANAEECWEEMKKHEPFGWVEYRNRKIYLVGIGEVLFVGKDVTYEFAFEDFTFADGAPFGIQVDGADD